MVLKLGNVEQESRFILSGQYRPAYRNFSDAKFRFIRLAQIVLGFMFMPGVFLASPLFH